MGEDRNNPEFKSINLNKSWQVIKSSPSLFLSLGYLISFKLDSASFSICFSLVSAVSKKSLSNLSGNLFLFNCEHTLFGNKHSLN